MAAYKKIGSFTLLAAAFGLLVFLFVRYRMAPAMDVQSGKFYTIKKESVSFSEGPSGKVLIFFQTWCGPCIHELRVWSKYAEAQNDLRIYAITDETPDKITPLLDFVHPDISIVLSAKPLRELQIYSFPTSYYFPAGSKSPRISKVGALLPSDIP